MGCSGSVVHEAVDVNEEKDFYGQYILGPKLGHGAFAQVHDAFKVDANRIQSTETANENAVKILDVRGSSPDARRKKQQAVRLEEALWNAVGAHFNCVRLCEVFHGDDLCYMVMEKCNYSLFRYLAHIPELTERTMGHVFRQMLQGICHVHEAHVVHRDIKPDNFLVAGATMHTVKLTDFGLSDRLLKGRKLRGIFGTAPFMCPEMLDDRHYDGKADVWSMGASAYALLFGGFPYMPREATSKLMKMAILDGIPPKFHDGHHRSNDAVAFVKALLRREPQQRPSAADALQSKFMMESVNNLNVASGVELPSLRPILFSAKTVGAIEARVFREDAGMDRLLSTLQTEKRGTPSPPAESGAQNSKPSSDGGLSSRSTSFTSGAPSNLELLQMSTGGKTSSVDHSPYESDCQSSKMQPLSARDIM